MKVQGHIPASAPPGAREGSDLDVPLITRIALILGGILVLLVVATAVIFDLYEKQFPQRTSEAQPIVTFAELPPAPRLQATPRLDFQEVRAQEDAHLEGYAWVDRAKGTARIPIERAMALWVELQHSATAGPSPGGSTTNATPLNPFPVTAQGGASPGPTSPSGASPASQPGSVTELQMRQDKAKEAAHAH